MSYNCIICSDLLSSSDQVYATKCGHAFHYTCLLNWVERSKTCPQCRNKTTEKSIFRLYFNVVSSEGITLDVGVLQNKLDNAEFSLREKTKELSDLREETEKLKCKNETMKIAAVEYGHRLGTKDIAIKMLQEQIDFLRQQNDEISSVRAENEKLKKNLDSCKSLNDILTATAENINSLINQNLDREMLCTWVTVLKKQVFDSDSKKKVLRESMRKLKNELTEANSQNNNLKIRVRDMEERLEELEKKINEKETELEQLKNKCKENSDVIFETPENCGNKRKRIIPVDDPEPPDSGGSEKNQKFTTNVAESDSPYFNLKQGNVVLAQQYKMKKALMTSPSKLSILNSDRISKLGSSSISTMLKSANSTSSESDLSYDGLGGHSKLDSFPVRSNPFKSHTLDTKKTKSIFKRVQRPPDQQTISSLFKK